MTRVALFEFDDWTCEWNPRRGLTFKRPGETIVFAINGAWKAGMPPIQTRSSIVAAWRRPPLFASVERNVVRRSLPYTLRPPAGDDPTAEQSIYDRPLVGTPGSNQDGAQVSGAGFSLDPQPTPDCIEKLDRNIERHPGPWMLHFDTGEPLTRDDLGWSQEYALNEATWWEGAPQHFPITAVGSSPSTPYDGWKRYAGSHLMRLLTWAIAAWRRRRCPVARAALIMLGVDVMRSFPMRKLDPRTDGVFRNELSEMQINSLGWAKGSGQIGVVRWFAHCLRAVVEAQRVAPSTAFAQWLVMAIDTVRNLQMTNGSFGSNGVESAASEQGQPWTVVKHRHDGSAFRLLRPAEREVPSWQLTFLVRALYEANRALMDGMKNGQRRPRADLDAAVSAAVCIDGYARIWRTCKQREEDEYHPGVRGLPYWLIVADESGPIAEIGEGIGLADTTYDADARWCAAQLGVEVPE